MHLSQHSPFLTILRWLFGSLAALLLGLLSLDGITAAPSNPATDGSQRRSLTFEDRVAAQKAIEEVLWQHRIWPTENPGPKPALEAVFPDPAIRAKVTDTLKKSNAMERFWGRPLTAEQLQSEMDRMAKHTRQPDVLREIFTALGDDPTLIAECLVRPRLAENLLRSRYAFEPRFHNQLRDEAKRSLSQHPIAGGFRPENGEYQETTLKAGAGGSETEPYTSTDSGAASVPRAEYESMLAGIRSSAGANPARFGALHEDETSFFARAILNEGQDSAIVATWRWAKPSFEAWWSAQSGSLDTSLEPQDGFIPAQTVDSVDCTDNTWTPISPGSPDPRQHHTAVWTGTEMIVWGGIGQNLSLYLNTGGRYEPATDTWSPTNSAVGEAPEGRIFHTAIWTGTEMIVWGGITAAGVRLSSGGRYNPASDSWTMTGTGANLPAPRSRHSAIWSGTAMIVWGGLDTSNTALNSGGRYDASQDAWSPTSLGANLPSGRFGHTATWTDSEMFVWGGSQTGGGLYNPASDSWRTVSTTLAPTSGVAHTAVWTGAEIIVWGGSPNPTPVFPGGRFNPASNTWSPTSTAAGVPANRQYHSAVWAKGEMIVWGGYSGVFASGTQTGGRYDPANNTWTATGMGTDVPSARYDHTAVWTGTEMLVWGGYSNGFLGTGSRYCRQCATSFNNYRDQDLDGYGDPAGAQATCNSIPMPGFVSTNGDCLDTNPAVYPASPQLCDGLNNDCSDPSWPVAPANEANADGDAFRICQGDCDDARNNVYPGAPQLCDGLNNDCLDGPWPTPPGNEADQDGDGFRVCSPDCWDGNAQVWSSPSEVSALTLLAGAPTTLSWPSQAVQAGPETIYDLVGGSITNPLGSLDLSAAACLQPNGPNSFTDNRLDPAVGAAYWYLARGRNSCGTGTYGASSGQDRDATIPACP